MPKVQKVLEVSSPDPDDSPQVIAYRVGKLEETIKVGFQEHNDKLDKLVNSFATKADVNSLTARVASLESDRKWLVRLVVGAVVFSLLALVGIGFKTIGGQ